MASNLRKTNQYLAAFFGSVLVLSVISGLRIGTLVALCLVFAIVFSAIVLSSQRNDRPPHFSLTFTITLSLIFVVTRPLMVLDDDPHGISASIRGLLLYAPIWTAIPSAVFAGLCLQSARQDETAGRHITSLAPDVSFGMALMMGFYSTVRIINAGSATFLPQSNLSPLWGSTVIHFVIIFLFFVLLSYILRSYLRTISARSFDNHKINKNSKLLPEEQSLRWFVRVLIGTLPLFGFLGTVYGITQAMSGLPFLLDGASNSNSDVLDGLSQSFGSIAIAFETTMLGLVASLIASVSLSYVEKLDSDLAESTA